MQIDDATPGGSRDVMETRDETPGRRTRSNTSQFEDVITEDVITPKGRRGNHSRKRIMSSPDGTEMLPEKRISPDNSPLQAAACLRN
jgi:hypothetical protein